MLRVSVKPVTLDLLIAVALDNSLLTLLHRRLLRWGIGSSGAEGLAAAHLTSSLDNSMLIAPMPLSDPSVKPVLLSFPHLAQLAHPIAPMHRASVYPATIGCTDGRAIGLTGAADSASSCPIRRGDQLDTSNIFYLWIFTILWHLDSGLDLSS